jgi:hypothetical protein
VILLSGDVHYGFSAVMDYWKGDAATPTARIVQVTASSFKNAFMDNVHFLKSGMVQRILTGFDGKLEKMGWKDKELNTAGRISPHNKARLKKSVAVVPLIGWEPGATVTPAPDFRWRLRFVADDRIRKDKPEDPDPTDLLIDADGVPDAATVKTKYKEIVLRHQKEFKSGISRRLVWSSNVSLLHFEGAADAWILKNNYLFDSETKVDTHILHSISFVPPAIEQQKPEFPILP